MHTLEYPEFHDGALELRFEKDEIAIYGTQQGLRRLAEICFKLAERAEMESTSHVHLEDYHLLTAKSFPGTIAVFR